MKVLKIKADRIQVQTISGQKTVVARYDDENGTYFLNEDLRKQYCSEDYDGKYHLLRDADADDHANEPFSVKVGNNITDYKIEWNNKNREYRLNEYKDGELFSEIVSSTNKSRIVEIAVLLKKEHIRSGTLLIWSYNGIEITKKMALEAVKMNEDGAGGMTVGHELSNPSDFEDSRQFQAFGDYLISIGEEFSR